MKHLRPEDVLQGKTFDPAAADHIEAVIDYLMFMAFGTSNIQKPWKDQCYGTAATALSYCLRTDHPRHPLNGGIWAGYDREEPASRPLTPQEEKLVEEALLASSSPVMKTATYTGLDGESLVIEYDPGFLCIYCDLPVGEASMGGTAVCPACDCGMNRDGTPWTLEQSNQHHANARRRIAEAEKETQSLTPPIS